MSSVDERFLLSVVDAVEEEESKGIVWGLVDGLMTSADLADLLNPIIDDALESGRISTVVESREVTDALLERGWLVPALAKDGSRGFRSRMAEVVRLLLRLRQLFPKHEHSEGGWQTAPALVADFRFQRRARRFPRRDIDARSAAFESVSALQDPSFGKALRALQEASPQLSQARLAAFQVRATARLLGSVDSSSDASTIVCAGTGSGKTLAFYLPALTCVIRHLANDPNAAPWVKVVAVYPRNELLKDQLAEVIRRCRALPESVDGAPIRRTRVAALYGDVPQRSGPFMRWPKSWRRLGPMRVSPSIRCLNCDAELGWLESDALARKDLLRCVRECGFSIDDSELALTRASMAKCPPDILLTTTEMINRRLSDTRLSVLFGVGKKAIRVPDLVLLDEAHTYEGRHGAQVAYLMRRWQQMCLRPLRFVGLSATLRESSSFFAALTGVHPSRVMEVTPRADEMISDGAEYMIALRGDPVSRSALLSTTIQAVLLMQRSLDAPSLAPGSSSIFGKRSFVFTDDLDVTNRLYFNLLDAEGRTSSGRPKVREAPNGGLAFLRREKASLTRYHAGQDWRALEHLGHNLRDRSRVSRVSSQDRGVDADADVVVATAALEVGFDDPRVGAVVQHKAPRASAGFLQRKGRAGRVRGMRPWTAIVLSDYGRDRAAYQNYDHLFDPELPVRTLPLANRHIKRIGATYALIDYLGERVADIGEGSAWNDLAAPGASPARRSALVREIKYLLEDPAGVRRLASHLKRALAISAEEAEALLWEYPRPIMTTVLPTALRRLSSNWLSGGIAKSEFHVRDNPLPEFAPSSLFGDLSIAETLIELPAMEGISQPEAAGMPVFSALREFAPGRISRRFGVHHGRERYWCAPPAEALESQTESVLEVETLGTVVPIGTFELERDGKQVAIPVYRPTTMHPSIPGATIADSSNARLTWSTQLVPLSDPLWLDLPGETVWAGVIHRLGFYLHSQHAPLEVRRFAAGSVGEVGVAPGDRRRVATRFTHAGETVALGASYTADSLLLQLTLPSSVQGLGLDNGDLWKALRTIRYTDSARRGTAIESVQNPFQREWLARIVCCTVAFEALERGVDLRAALSAVSTGTSLLTLEATLDRVFLAQVIEVSGEEPGLSGDEKLKDELNALLRDPIVRSQLLETAKCLYEPISEDWYAWVTKTLHTTIAAAALKAIGDLCPDIDTDQLYADLDRGPTPGIASPVADLPIREVWITENSTGGIGLIESFMRRYSEDPRRFLSLLASALETGEFERIDTQMKRVLSMLAGPPGTSLAADSLRKMRNTSKPADLARLGREARGLLMREEIVPFHSFMVSLTSRLLRHGADDSLDAYLSEAVNRWDSEEERLGIEIDASVFSFWLAQTTDLSNSALDLGTSEAGDHAAWRMNAIYGLLWPRGYAVRQASLQMYNPFLDHAPVERLLAAAVLNRSKRLVYLDQEDWLEQAGEQLAGGRMVSLTTSAQNREQLALALEVLICNPIESGYLRGYARLQAIHLTGDVIRADVELVESVQ